VTNLHGAPTLYIFFLTFPTISSGTQRKLVETKFEKGNKNFKFFSGSILRIFGSWKTKEKELDFSLDFA